MRKYHPCYLRQGILSLKGGEDVKRRVR